MMMKGIGALMLTCSLAAAAMAEERVKMSLTYNQVLEMQQALTALDGEDRAIGSGANERVIKLPYDFSGTFLIAKFHDMTALREDLNAFDAARREIVKKHAGESGQFAQTDGHPSEAQLRAEAEIVELAATRHDLLLVKLNLKDFNLDHNRVPGSALSALAPLINE